ncbi:MAG: PhzF family phenazine biosynthesis protein [Cyanobacteria bacterium]|nr:PhzF family phenazine biosynthesis protein [Cyanobacteriota bacterium]
MPQLTRRSWMSLFAAALPAALSATAAPLSAQQVRRPSVVNGRRYLQYDVFTDKPLAGNQLAVFTETAGLTAAEMQAMTRETKFSECTFVQPAEAAGTDVRLRIFGPANEMQFAGHPVIGSTFALADDGVIAAGRKEFTFGLGIGPTLVELEWATESGDSADKRPRLQFAWMTQQKPVFGPTLNAPTALAGALGIDPSALRPGLLPQEVNCGSAFFFVPLVSRAAVDQAVVDTRAAAAMFEAAKITRRGLFIFSTEPGADGATCYSRMMGANEDPATGSASGPLGCYLVKHGLVPADKAGSIVSAQGVKMGRPSRIHIKIDLAGGEISRVRVGGTSVLVGEGRLRSS